MLDAPRDVDYILTPETAVDADLWENTLERNPLILDLQKFMGENFPSSELILGAETYYQYGADEEPDFTARHHAQMDFWWDYNNTALGIDSSSRIEIYHKARPLIGVEKLPYARFFRGLERFSVDMGGLVGQIGLTPRDTVFASPDGLKVGVAICWDEVYGEYISKYVENGARTLFIITNEGWWGDTRGYKQLFAFSRLRAVETRTAIGRSANTGISGFINGRGDVIASLGWDRRGTLTEDMALNTKQTVYVRRGDWIGRLSCLVAGLCLLYFLAYRIRKRDHMVE
jgi:apolipoprotein N-acyltransferase